MTRSQRRLLIATSVLGLSLTLLVIALDGLGVFAAPERFFYDRRARLCQYFTPPPTDKLVHVDIDDRALEVIGAWPWPRSRLAMIVDEMRLAGAKALAMDIIFSEPQPPGYEEIAPAGAATRPAGVPSTQPVVLARRIDHDAAFAAALARFGNAVVPLSLNLPLHEASSPGYRAMVAALTDRPMLERDALLQLLRDKGYDDLAAAESIRFYASARREAMFERIVSESRQGLLDLAELRRRILPDLGENIGGAPILRLLERQYDRYLALDALRPFARAVPAGLPPLVSAKEELATVPALTRAASSSGYVDYIPMADGVVRTVPLWAEHRNLMYPQVGLALACAMLDVPLREVKLEPDRVLIPRPDGSRIAIPVRRQKTHRGTHGMYMDIPWFGTDNWETSYDYPAHRQSKQHLPILLLWEARQIEQRIVNNNRNADRAIGFILDKDGANMDDAAARKYFASPPPPEDFDSRRQMIRYTLEQAGPWLDQFKTMTDAELDAQGLRLMRDNLRASHEALSEAVKQNQGLQEDLARRRASLREQLGGKAALIGWISVGATVDIVTTSLHARCPGVVVHGTIFNAIMTGRFWRAAPFWGTALCTLVLGAAATAGVAWLSWWRAILATVLLALLYLLFNGIYLFDYLGTLVGMAGPLTAVTGVWAGGTLSRYVLESAERRRAENLFKNYVDPVLVDYVLHDGRVDGELKELSVVFTDLQGFTTLSERLREDTVPLLNRYFGLMVPIIRRHRGYLNKLLGDGIMYFFAAPIDNPRHAVDACASVLEMQQAMGELNRELQASNLPPLMLRAGLSSGKMVVGACGPSDRSFSDYTVLGDTVNLGSRLEGANKAFGTRILLNERARVLVGDEVLFRPVGMIQVVGKKEGVRAFEALSFARSATDDQKRLADLTERVVCLFQKGAFADCLQAVARLEETFGAGKLTALYRMLCETYLVNPPEAFDGQIVLTEK